MLDGWLESVHEREEGIVQEPDFPSPLYYYTSRSTLLDILEDNCIWASNIAYMNDRSELSYSSQLAQEVLDILWEARHPPTPLEKPNIENSLIAEQRNIHPFALCLSEKEDHLPQWREYADRGEGYSIGLDLRDASFSLETEEPVEIRAYKIIYDPEKQSQTLAIYINEWIDIMIQMDEEEVEEASEHLRTALVEALNDCMFRFKHPKFKSEKEWRLLASPGPDIPVSNRLVKFRDSKRSIIPYVEFTGGDDPGVLPIAEVYKGPQIHPDLGRQSLRMLLDSHDYEGVEVKSSEIPLGVV